MDPSTFQWNRYLRSQHSYERVAIAYQISGVRTFRSHYLCDIEHLKKQNFSASPSATPSAGPRAGRDDSTSVLVQQKVAVLFQAWRVLVLTYFTDTLDNTTCITYHITVRQRLPHRNNYPRTTYVARLEQQCNVLSSTGMTTV
jgi:hypothetical protein